MIGRWFARYRLPDPEALAAGLVAEPMDGGWRYHNPELRAHLRARAANMPVETVDSVEPVTAVTPVPVLGTATP